MKSLSLQFSHFLVSFDLVLGAGRVTFSSRVSFMSAVSCRFLQVTYGDIDKKVGATNNYNVALLYSLELSLWLNTARLGLPMIPIDI